MANCIYMQGQWRSFHLFKMFFWFWILLYPLQVNAALYETNRHINVGCFSSGCYYGPWNDPVSACKAEVEPSNYTGIRKITGVADYACDCQSNAGNDCGYVYKRCPIGYGYDGLHWDLLGGVSISFASPGQDPSIPQTYGCPLRSIDKLKNLDKGCGVGNPINPGTGNKFQVEKDYVGSNSLPLTLTRTYNSDSIFSFNFGAHWISFYDNKVLYDAYDESYVTVQRPTGQILYFWRKSNGVFAPDTDIQDRLIRLTNTNGSLVGWKYTVASNQNIEMYDASGKLLSISNRAGATQTLAYTNGLLQSVTDPAGRQITFAYDTSSRVVSATTPNGIYGYTYSANGVLSRVTYPDSAQRVYLYEDTRFPTYLTGITDENGKRFATYAYDDQGRAISSEHAGGAGRVSLAYNADGTTAVTDALGATRTYSFQTVLGMVKNSGLTQPCASCGGSSKSTAYDTQGNVASRTDFSGNRTDYTYDLGRNLETKRVEGLTQAGATTSATRTTTTEWHPTWRLPKRMAEPLKTTTYVYHGDNGVSCGVAGSLCSKTVQATTDTNGSLGFSATASGTARTWSYTYNSQGQVLTENGPRTDVTDVTTYAYYTDTTTSHRVGDLWKVTNALGHVTTINSYDAAGRPLSITNPNTLATTLTYSPRGWLKSVSLGGGITTTYTYDNVGQLTKVSLPDTREYTYAYDAAHRLKSITSNTGEILIYTLDAAGNHLSEILADASGAVATQHRQAFDAAGQLQKSITNVQGVDAATTYTYDSDGNLASEASPTSRTSTYGYDALERLTQVQASLSGSPITTQYAYNGQSVATQTKAPNNATTTNTTNGYGETVTEASPDRGSTTYTYDTAGNVKSRTDARGITLSYAYDALNRLTQVTSPTVAENITYTYDSNASPFTCTNGKGRLCKVVDQSGTTTLAYDARGNVTKRAVQTGGVTYTTTFVYDPSNKLLMIGLPNGGYLFYGRDNNRRLATVSTLANGVDTPVLSAASYRPDGQPTSLTYGNGETITHSYDTGGRRTTTTRSVNGTTETFTWNLEGELVQRAIFSDAKTYQYDALGRLIKEGTPTTTLQSFAYDANGNRLSNGSNTYTYTANSNRMATRKGVSITLDAAGNTTANSLGQTYTWDTHGHYSQFSLSGVKKATYLYNSQHQRVQKTLWNGTTALSTTVYHYDLAGRLLMETSGTGAAQATYVYGDDGRPMAVVYAANSPYNAAAQDQLLYLHTDHLGTPRMATDSAKRIVWKWDADAFGSTVVQQDPDSDGKLTTINLRFLGQYFDAESGLHYNWNRTYDPSLGRYISSDPIGLDGGLNTFGYVGQSPLTFADPNGLCPICVGALAFLGEAGTAGGAATAAVTTTSTGLGFWGAGALVGGGLGLSTLSGDTTQASIWGDGATDHPSHDDERDALSTPLSATCEELAWAISVLQAGIDWRKGDIARHGGNNPRAPGHRQWIKKLQDKLDQLLREHNLRCEEKCEDK